MPNRIPKACAYPRCGETTLTRYCDKHRKKNTKVFLVIGPSGSGKTTLVKERARKGDLIIDFDTLFQALSGCELYDKPDCLLPFVLSARDGIINMIGTVDDVNNAWVIRNKTTRAEVNQLQRQLDAEVIELRVPPDECKRRIVRDSSRPDRQKGEWFRRIDEWWRDHG